MPGRTGLRLFLFLAAVAVPPLVAYAVLAAIADRWLGQIGTGTFLALLAVVALGWAAVLAVAWSRSARADLQAIVRLAERGAPPGPGDVDRDESTAYQRLSRALEERNRQVAELATQLRAAPIDEDARAVASSTVASAAVVTGDPTWSLVVLRSPDPELLPVGVYGQDVADPKALGDVHRWASTLEAARDAIPEVRHAAGPWGAFTIVEVAAGDELRACLIAPWEGREPPSRSERELLSVLGQSSATAIEHALLYARTRHQAEELNRLAAIQTDFLRGVTHDLQTPLTSIRAHADELRQQPGMTGEAQADLETIAHQAERLRRMVSQLLVTSRLEAGHLQPQQEVFDAEPLIRRTWTALRATDRPFQLVVAGERRLVVGDPDRFEQVLWALLDNAVKYSPPGGPVEVRLAPMSHGEHRTTVEICVRDEGTGMSADDLDRAFDQFYRAAAARRMAPDGSGVGLYAARGLVRAMGGDLELKSSLGKGTSALLWLPAEVAAEESVASA